MPRDSFAQQLDTLREDVLALGNVVESRLRKALTAVDTLDPELAREVVDGDAAINATYLELEADCIDLLALQQPVAGDLRFVTAAFKISTDLERIADLAVNLASLAETLVAEVTGDTFAAVPLVEIGELALEQLDDALHAFAERDPDLCRAVAARDEELNAQCVAATETIIRELVTYSPTAGPAVEVRPPAVRDVLVLVRDLERVGDHAVNIAARTLYMAENDDALLY